MPMLYPLPLTAWDDPLSGAESAIATDALEAGHVLVLPNLRFELAEAELAFLRTDAVGGAVAALAVHDLRALLDRYAAAAQQLVTALFPSYARGVHPSQTHLGSEPRPERRREARVRVDSFRAQPSHGKRILRVFSNVAPSGRAAVWRVGEPFEAVAQRFWNDLRPPLPGERGFLATVRVTNGVRSRYDHYMLKLHDAMAHDRPYQRQFEASTCEFPAGSTWVCFTDQVSHAAVSATQQITQTFWVDVSVLRHQESAPLRVLESLAGRKLA